MTFTVTGWNGPVGHAVLRLRTNGDNDGSDDGGTVRAVATPRGPEEHPHLGPGPGGGDGPRSRIGRDGTSSTWYDVDVTASVTGNGTYGFTISSDSDTPSTTTPRETGDHAPQLVLHTAGPGGAGKRSGADTRAEVLVGAGDVGACDNDHARSRRTSWPRSRERSSRRVTPTRTTARAGGTTSCFTRWWGRFERIRPAPAATTTT